MEHVGEVRGMGAQQAEGPFPPRPPGLTQTPSSLVLLCLGCVQHWGGLRSDSALVPPRHQAWTSRRWLCAPGTVMGPRKVGESPSHGPAWGSLEVAGDESLSPLVGTWGRGA